MLAAFAGLLLGACTIEVGPPPESDPPLVSEADKGPPPPAQPTEPQPWSRDLDLDGTPVAADRSQMTKGLVAGEAPTPYSGQRLTFESALNPEKPPSEAELARQRAQKRAAAAGLPAPPEVVPVPVTAVEAESLPPAGEASAAPRRESRLPPPPKFPPVEGKPAKAGAAEADAVGPAQAPQQAAVPSPAAPGAAEPAAAPEGAAAFAAEAWDAPGGTILVQVSAVPDGSKVFQEWERLQMRYPQVLKPLRLVVEEARLEGKGVFYRVQAGAFGTQQGAAEACDRLISQGQACFVVVR